MLAVRDSRSTFILMNVATYLTVAVVQREGSQRLIPTDPERAARMVGTMREQLHV